MVGAATFESLARAAGVQSTAFRRQRRLKRGGELKLISIGTAILMLTGTTLSSSAQVAKYASSAEAASSSSTTVDDSSLEDHRNEFGFWMASSFGLPSALGGSRDAGVPF